MAELQESLIASVEAADTSGEQTEGARALLACLEEAGVEGDLDVTWVEGHETSFLAVQVKLTEDDATAYHVPNSRGSGSGKALDAVGDQFYRAVEENAPFLYYKGTDMTGTLVSCIDSSGFYLPAPVTDPAAEQVEKQAMAEVSNEWAACAREAGLAGVKDAVVTVDGWETMPEALVPVATDVEAFRQVLRRCAPISPERDLTATQNVNGEGGGEAPIDPRIAVDAPADDPRRQALEQVLVDEVTRLYEQAAADG
ncbi:MAG: hypothetical protein LBR19_07610 [Bifidobacteriaceae bacterium]|nr:hypothetical protein [Bifidobacteriaceae bacterium]